MTESNLKRVMATVNHPLFVKEYNKISESEKDRQFCRHDMNHLTDVARIAYILSMERNLSLNKELIYAAAYLHDIGRCYENHEIASAKIAKEILSKTGFTSEENDMICDAILQHRRGAETTSELSDILHEADKLSRRCFECQSYEECNWSEDLKNKTLKY